MHLVSCQAQTDGHIHGHRAHQSRTATGLNKRSISISQSNTGQLTLLILLLTGEYVDSLTRNVRSMLMLG